MSYLDSYTQELGGFNFEYAQRNKIIEANKAIQKQPFKKTGTTIVGLKFKVLIILFRTES